MNSSKSLGTIWKVYCVILIIQALFSLHPWFVLGVPPMIATIAQFLIAASLLFLVSKFWDIKNPKKITACILIVIIYVFQAFVDGGNVNFFIVHILSSFTLIPLLLLKSQYLVDSLDKFQKVMAVILSVSLFFWIIHLIGIDLPSTELTYGTTNKGNGDEDLYLFSNYYVFLVDNSWMMRPFDEVPSFLRFSSIFLEPGYLSILMVFFLFIGNFSLKNKRNIIFILTIIATISLAGFIMVIMAFLARKIRSAKQGMAVILLVSLIALGGYIFFKNYNGGNNFVNELIIERLEYDESEGTIAGYNRTNSGFDYQYERFVKSSDVVLGIGREEVSDIAGNNVGYKAFIMSYGIMGLLFFLLFIFVLARIGGNYLSYVLFVLYIVMFIRGDVTMYWHAFILVYVGGIALSKLNNIPDEKNRHSCALQRV